MVKGNFEGLLGISKSRAEKVGKPFAAVEKYSGEDVEISEDIKRIVREVYEWNHFALLVSEISVGQIKF